jgi:RHS repeat-associated protein
LAVEYSSASLTPACNTCYLAYDGVGSVRLITDENGGVVARHDYLPYGEEIPNGLAGRNGNFGFPSNLTQGFTGQELDGATSTMSSGTAELEYFNARHMSAVLGSFTQPDPMQAGADFLNPQSWNAYAYAGGQPLVYTDPSGMNWFSGIGATISSIFSSLFGSGNDGCDPGVDFCGGTVQSGGAETTSTPGGGGLFFPSGGGSSGGGGGGGGSAYDNGDVFRATSFISNPAKTGTQGCDDSTNNRSRFFSYLPGMLDVAKQLNVPSTYINSENDSDENTPDGLIFY